MRVGCNLRRGWLGQKTQSNQVGGESLEHHWYEKKERNWCADYQDYEDISASTQPKPPSSLLSEDKNPKDINRYQRTKQIYRYPQV